MQDPEPQGCLAAILLLFGIKLAKPQVPNLFRLRDDFLSPAEFSFYKVLASVLDPRFIICPKVRLGDIVYVPGQGNQGLRNKIDRKHIDFLICDAATMKPRCALELDDQSHTRPDRQSRDDFVNQVFASANLPLLHIPNQRAYNPAELLAALQPSLEPTKPKPPRLPAAQSSLPPTCPKCRVPMVERIAKRSPNAGKPFYGCPNYPRCHETVPIH